MHWLGGVVGEQLIHIVERSPDAFGNGEENWNLLRCSEEVTEASTSE